VRWFCSVLIAAALLACSSGTGLDESPLGRYDLTAIDDQPLPTLHPSSKHPVCTGELVLRLVDGVDQEYSWNFDLDRLTQDCIDPTTFERTGEWIWARGDSTVILTFRLGEMPAAYDGETLVVALPVPGGTSDWTFVRSEAPLTPPAVPTSPLR